MSTSGVFRKLQLKDQADIFVLDSPGSFEEELAGLDGVRVRRKLGSADASFVLAFMTKRLQLERFANELKGRVPGDGLVWVAYPKRSSKRYASELGRDAGWAPLGELGFEPVRMVAIDEDWSAIRFRKVEFIKQLKRGSAHAISKAGKKKAGQSARQ